MAELQSPGVELRDDGSGLIRFESYGVRIDVDVDDIGLVHSVLPMLPPGWQPAPDSFADAQFVVFGSGEGLYVVRGENTGRIPQAVDLDVAMSLLEGHIRMFVASWAPERIFVHAGVVAHDGRALVIPGESFSGKTTLVAALVRAGASYLSDEFAVLDADGFVHPYPKPLWLRSRTGGPTAEVTADALGGTTADTRIPVALVAVTRYVPGARWDPAPLSAGQAALALLSDTVPAQERPAEALHVLRRVAERCACVQSSRDEADEIVAPLLSLLDAS
jgi:hypothetical protein